MLNRSKHTGDGHAWNTMLDMEVCRQFEEAGGGVRNLGGGFAKRGVRTNPPNPPGYGPASSAAIVIIVSHCLAIIKQQPQHGPSRLFRNFHFLPVRASSSQPAVYFFPSAFPHVICQSAINRLSCLLATWRSMSISRSFISLMLFSDLILCFVII